MADRRVTLLALAALGAASASLLAGCSSAAGGLSSPAESHWVCSWDPTMNHDWHDDYLCTDGASEDRPYLLPDDSFVERSEIDQAAAAYESQLNS
jgi:hypothetical protein